MIVHVTVSPVAPKKNEKNDSPTALPQCDSWLCDDLCKSIIVKYLPWADRLYLNRHEHARALEEAKLERLRRYFPPHIVDALGGEEACTHDTRYAFVHSAFVQRDLHGVSSYIDRVRFEHVQCVLPGKTICIGIDEYKRPFVVLVYYARKGCDQDPTPIVTTLFQRYAESNSCWALGTCYPRRFLFSDTPVNENGLEQLSQMIHGCAICTTFGSHDAVNVLHMSRGTPLPPQPHPAAANI